MKESPSEVELRQRVKRLERHHLFLNIAVVLLAIENLRSVLLDRRIVYLLQLIMENLDLFCQQINSIAESIQRVL